MSIDTAERELKEDPRRTPEYRRKVLEGLGFGEGATREGLTEAHMAAFFGAIGKEPPDRFSSLKLLRLPGRQKKGKVASILASCWVNNFPEEVRLSIFVMMRTYSFGVLQALSVCFFYIYI